MRPLKISVLVAVLTGLLLLGCDQMGGPTQLDDDVKAFVEDQPLSEAQEPEVVFESPTHNVQAFRVAFGEARDCPSGCFYSQAYGLKFQDRIGWMGFDAYGQDDSVRTAVTFFDVQPGDSALFGEDLRNQFEEGLDDSDRSYAESTYDHFLQMLGRDEHTPANTLLEIAQRLAEEYHPDVGLALLENSVVRSRESILQVLAELPDKGGYRTVRDRAQELLDQLSSENTAR